MASLPSQVAACVPREQLHEAFRALKEVCSGCRLLVLSVV